VRADNREEEGVKPTLAEGTATVAGLSERRFRRVQVGSGGERGASKGGSTARSIFQHQRSPITLPPLGGGRLGASGSDTDIAQAPSSIPLIPHWAIRIPQSSGTTTMGRGSLVGERLPRQRTSNGSQRGGVPSKGGLYLDSE